MTGQGVAPAAVTPAVAAAASDPALGGSQRLQRGILTVAALMIVIAAVRAVEDLVLSLAFAAIVTIVLVPLRNAIVARGHRGSTALLLSIAAYLAVLLVLGGLLILGLAQFVRDWPSYQAQVQHYADQIRGTAQDLGLEPLLDTLKTSILAIGAAFVGGSLVGIAVSLGVSVVFALYMLLDVPGLSQRSRVAFGENSLVIPRMRRLGKRITDYVIARAILGAAAAAVDTLLLIAVGVPSPLLWGVLSFALSFIPNVGFILSLIPPALLALLSQGWGAALVVVVGYCVINVTVDYVIQPKFIGASVGLSPAVVFFSLIIWAEVLGPVGALLSVPLTILVAEVCADFAESRWIATLLGSRVEPDEPALLGPAGPASGEAQSSP